MVECNLSQEILKLGISSNWLLIEIFLSDRLDIHCSDKDKGCREKKSIQVTFIVMCAVWREIFLGQSVLIMLGTVPCKKRDNLQFAKGELNFEATYIGNKRYICLE